MNKRKCQCCGEYDNLKRCPSCERRLCSSCRGENYKTKCRYCIRVDIDQANLEAIVEIGEGEGGE